MAATAPSNLPSNNFKIALREGRRQIGLWSGLCSNVVAEVLAHAGYDWIVVDGERVFVGSFTLLLAVTLQLLTKLSQTTLSFLRTLVLKK